MCAIVVVQSTVDRGRLNIPGVCKKGGKPGEKSSSLTFTPHLVPELQWAVRPAVPDVLWPEAC